MVEFQHVIDTSGTNCPLPLLKAKKALNSMSSGEVLKIISTDPGAVHDFQAFSKQTGNELITCLQEDDKLIIFLKRR